MLPSSKGQITQCESSKIIEEGVPGLLEEEAETLHKDLKRLGIANYEREKA